MWEGRKARGIQEKGRGAEPSGCPPAEYLNRLLERAKNTGGGRAEASALSNTHALSSLCSSALSRDHLLSRR